MPTAQDLYDATRMLFRAFQYLQPRMHGGSLSPAQDMNDEALAGCILHGCMSRVLRDIQAQRELAPRKEWPAGWIAPPLSAAKGN